MQKLFWLFTIACLQVTFGVITEDMLSPSQKECLKELDLSADLLINNFHEDWTVTEGIEDFNRASLCSYRKDHFLKDDDTLDVTNFQDFLISKYFPAAKFNYDNPSEAASNGIEACRSVQGSDAGDTVVKHYNCIVNHFKPINV